MRTMIRENIDRNSIIYELWKKGLTIDAMAFKTGIPRSTVGYYVRKFNKRARRGEPIAFLPEKAKSDEEGMAFRAIRKNLLSINLAKLTLDDKDETDRIYKILMITKLVKELQRELNPTKEEEKALDKYRFSIIKQIMDRKILPRIEKEKIASVSDTPKKKIPSQWLSFKDKR